MEKTPPIPRSAVFVALGLTLLAFLTFLPVLRCNFTDFDDPDYVTHNPHVLGGLTWADVRWAWTSDKIGYWQPLSFMSLMFDSTFFGTGAEGYHRTNLAFHALSAGVAFLVLFRLTGSLWRSALVAGLYAVHPLRVESVAWVAERKDVLSNLLAWLTIGGYVAYARLPNPRRYLLVLIPFALGLLAKPMLVTLPCLLLLLDFWPLRRKWDRNLILEKLPLFLLAFAAGSAAMKAQERCMALVSLQRYPIPYRIGTVLLGYASYLRNMVWFADLSAFYPLPTTWPLTLVAAAVAAALLLAGITYLAIAQRRERPWLLLGWFWFLGVMAPVSGIFQAGPQAMADRFTYLPSVGLLIMLVWSIPAVSVARQKQVALLACSVLLLLASASWVQSGYWKDNRTIFSRALAVNRDNWVAHDQIGLCDFRDGKIPAAIAECREALRLNPIDPVARVNLGLSDLQLGKNKQAAAEFKEALALGFDNSVIHTGLGTSLDRGGDFEGAYEQYKKASALDPGDAIAHSNMGGLLVRVGAVPQGIAELRIALQLNPMDESCRLKLQQATQLQHSVVADIGK